MTNTRLIDIALNGGQNEGADRIGLKPGELRALINGRVTRDGRIAVRPKYTALSTAVVAASAGLEFVASDLATYKEDLVGFGCLDTATNTRPVDVFTRTSAAAGVWKQPSDVPSPSVGSVGLSPVTDLTIRWQGPYGQIAKARDVAYNNGMLAVASTNPTTTTGVLYILSSADYTTLRTLNFASVHSIRVLAASGANQFVVLTRNTSGDIVGYTINTNTTSIALSSSSTLVSGELNDTFTWDASTIEGSTDFVVAYCRTAANATRIRRYTQAFSASWTTDIAGQRGNNAVIGRTTSTAGVVHIMHNSNDVEARTLNISTGAVDVGPTDVLGAAAGMGNAAGVPGVCFASQNTTDFMVISNNAISTTAGDLSTMWGQYSIAAHAAVYGPFTQSNTRTASKPVAFAGNIPLNDSYATVGSCVVGGNTSGTDQAYATTITQIGIERQFAARWNYGVSDRLTTDVATNYHGRSSIAYDGSAYYGTAAVLDESTLFTQNEGTAQLFSFKLGSTDRRQAVEAAGALYIAGGFVGYFDGGQIVEQNFLDTPLVGTITQSAGGNLTALGVYQYVAVYEWSDGAGRVHRSTPSSPRSVTLTVGNQQTSVNVSSPHGPRRTDPNSGGVNVKVVLYRTTAGDSVFFRVADSFAGTAVADYADLLDIADDVSDATAETRPILYNQAQKPIVNVAPLPSKYIAVGNDRLIYAGGPDPYLVQMSQPFFPGEPAECASPNSFAHVARLPDPVTAITTDGDSIIAFTAGDTYQIAGAGPQRNGQGEFFPPRSLLSGTGCIDWRSVVDTPIGTFFQSAPDRINVLTGGQAQWIGQPVRDTLAAYPTVTGGCYCAETGRVVFSVQSASNAAGRLLVYDTRNNAWSVDDIDGSSAPPTAATECDGRAAFVLSNVVYLEDERNDTGVAAAMPTLSVRTGSFGASGPMGYATLHKVGVLATYVGDCTVELFISYDDGKTWTSCGSQSVTAANTALANPVSGNALSDDDPVPLVWTPNIREVTRFALRADVSNASAITGGVNVHSFTLEVGANDHISRLPAGNQR